MHRLVTIAFPLVFAATVVRAEDGVLHDNGIVPDRVTGSPISVPLVPHVVSAEDFTVPEGEVWTVTGLRFVLSPAVDMDEGPVLGVRICTDSGGDGPLSPIYHATLPYARKPIGEYFGRPAYEYTVGGFELELGPGVYWTSPAMPRASRDAYATWLTTRIDDVARQGDLGWFSPDAMDTWFRMDELGWEGDYWHHAFQVLGRRDGPPIPEGARGAEGGRHGDGNALDDATPRRLKPAARGDHRLETGATQVKPAARGDHRLETGATQVKPAARGGHRSETGATRLEHAARDGAHAIREPEDPLTHGDLIWENNVLNNGVMARALSPPNFPDIRVADDIIAPEEGWIIREVRLDIIEDLDWNHGGDITMFIHEDIGGPGEMVREVTTEFTRIDTGDQYFGRQDYEYRIDGLEIELEAGGYWIGVRNANGNGAGTNYWMTSDGGRDGVHSDSGWFSLDAGQTWSPEGDGWDHAFDVYGQVGFGAIALPQRFEVTRGLRRAGGLLSLATSDDDYLVIAAIRPSSVSQPSVQVIVETVVAAGPISRLSFTVESATTLSGLQQWTDLYDFDADEWVRLDTRDASTDDAVVEVSPDDAERFRDDETGAMRARVSFWDPGVPIAGWFGRIDQAVWRVVH